MSEQTTPRTVEEAAREEAERRWPSRSSAPVADASRRAGFVAGAAWQAARMPGVEEVEAAMDEADRTDVAFNLLCGCGAYTSARHRRCRAERVVALWGAP